MTPDVVVDIGNSRVKWGRPRGARVRDVASLPPDEAAWTEAAAGLPSPAAWAVASVHPERLERFARWAEGRGDSVTVLRDYRDVPIRVDVDVPERVGVDRLLAAVGALRRVDEGTPVVVIDAGTAVTVDYVDSAGVFRGGAILPGPWLMAKALHDHTAKLPLLPLHEVPSADPPGRNTEAAMTVGVMAALMGACQVLVDEYSALGPVPPAVLMSGDAVGHLIDYDFAPDVGVGGPYPLVLEGLLAAARALP